MSGIDTARSRASPILSATDAHDIDDERNGNYQHLQTKHCPRVCGATREVALASTQPTAPTRQYVVSFSDSRLQKYVIIHKMPSFPVIK